MEKTDNEKKKKLLALLGSLLLFITALIWGFAFVAQNKGMESVGPLTFISLRSFIGAAMLIPLLILNRKKIFKVYDGKSTITEECGEITDRRKRMQFILTGVICIGLVFFAASSSQQIGMVFTQNVGKAGFITALYIVLVPLAGIFMKKRPGIVIYLCVVLATVGLYLLCIKKGSGFSLEKGDLLIIVCAVVFSAHMILIDYFCARINGILIAFCQFLIAGILGGITMFIFEKPTFVQIRDGIVPILYAGILSSGVGYTLQILGQRYVEPTKASLILCLESVFSVLGGFIFLHQTLTLREGIGCAVMFTAIIISQIFGNKPASLGADDVIDASPLG